MQPSFAVLTQQFGSTQRPTSLWTAGLIFSIERQCPTFRTASGPDRSSGLSRPHRRGGGGCGGRSDVVHHPHLLRTPPAPQPRRPVRRVPDGRDRPATPQGTMVRYSREPQNDVKCTFCWLSVRRVPGPRGLGSQGVLAPLALGKHPVAEAVRLFRACASSGDCASPSAAAELQLRCAHVGRGLRPAVAVFWVPITRSGCWRLSTRTSALVLRKLLHFIVGRVRAVCTTLSSTGLLGTSTAASSRVMDAHHRRLVSADLSLGPPIPAGPSFSFIRP